MHEDVDPAIVAAYNTFRDSRITGFTYHTEGVVMKGFGEVLWRKWEATSEEICQRVDLERLKLSFKTYEEIKNGKAKD